jgi:hypothetical protein
MARKITKANKQRYRDVLSGALTAFGASCIEVNSIGGETWYMETAYGPLEIFLHDDCVSYAIHSRFEDHVTASAKVSGCSRTGKWNHYIGGETKPDSAAYCMIDTLSSVLSLPSTRYVDYLKTLPLNELRERQNILQRQFSNGPWCDEATRRMQDYDRALQAAVELVA